jgi:hypothetical protein
MTVLPMTELPSTKDVITAMLKENTGTHFLDSGGAYGRSWQHNQVIDFDQTSPSKVEFDLERNEIIVTKRIYHWLLNQLEITEESQRYYDQLIAFSELDENKDLYWSGLYEEFAKHLNAIDYPEGLCKGDDGWKLIGGCNSYNHESSLSQVYQYDVLCNEDTGTRIIILQIHGGCDVRGGYTAPKFFQSNDCDEACFGYNDNDYAITLGKHYYYTDDGYHWYYNGCCRGFNNDKKDIIDMIRESVEQGIVPGIEPDETSFTLESRDLDCLYIEYKHKSDNCRTLDEFGVQS